MTSEITLRGYWLPGKNINLHWICRLTNGFLTHHDCMLRWLKVGVVVSKTWSGICCGLQLERRLQVFKHKRRTFLHNWNAGRPEMYEHIIE